MSIANTIDAERNSVAQIFIQHWITNLVYLKHIILSCIVILFISHRSTLYFWAVLTSHLFLTFVMFKCPFHGPIKYHLISHDLIFLCNGIFFFWVNDSTQPFNWLPIPISYHFHEIIKFILYHDKKGKTSNKLWHWCRLLT